MRCPTICQLQTWDRGANRYGFTELKKRAIQVTGALFPTRTHEVAVVSTGTASVLVGSTTGAPTSVASGASVVAGSATGVSMSVAVTASCCGGAVVETGSAEQVCQIKLKGVPRQAGLAFKRTGGDRCLGGAGLGRLSRGGRLLGSSLRALLGRSSFAVSFAFEGGLEFGLEVVKRSGCCTTSVSQIGKGCSRPCLQDSRTPGMMGDMMTWSESIAIV